MKLSATGVKGLREPGRYSDGNGLHLFIGRTGNRSWVQRVTIDGRRRDIGLGGYPAVSLKQARRQAALNRETIADGRDPLAERRRSTVPTFREAAQTVHAANRPRWRNHRHAASWLQTLERHAFPKIGSMPVDRIGRADVLSVLTPIWTTTPDVKGGGILGHGAEQKYTSRSSVFSENVRLRWVSPGALSNYLKMARRHCRRNHRSAHASCNTPR